MTKRFRATSALVVVIAAAACTTPTRPVTRTGGDTTIVVDSGGLTLRLNLNRHVLVDGDTLVASTMLVNHTSQPYNTYRTYCSNHFVTTLESSPFECGPVIADTVAPGDSIGRGGMWFVTSPPGHYPFTAPETGVSASILLEVVRP